jgi:hypothetical protein
MVHHSDCYMTTRQIGEVYSAGHTEYSEATQYCYYDGVHDLVLFWANPSAQEVRGFNGQPVEFALYVQQPVLFLLYRITDVCEWSDVAYNIHQLRAEEQEVPTETPGDYARVQMTLVDAGTGIIRAKRIVRMGREMTQAMRQTLQQQAQIPFSRFDYEALVQQTYARYPDSDAMLKNAVLTEAAATEN